MSSDPLSLIESVGHRGLKALEILDQANNEGFRELAIQGEFLTDLEAVRIANDNRIRALREDLGVEEGAASLKSAEAVRELFGQAESLAERELKRLLRATALHEWIKGTIGIGEKQAARLLAVIGHPCWRYDPEAEEWRERTIAQLWSYCGYAVVNGESPKRKRGEQSAYNTQARVRAYLIAESCIKQATSPYRVVYDEGRAKYADAVHPLECKRCGPSGKPAQVGSPLSDGHKHARAMRLTAKAILKDLWLAASEGQGPREPQKRTALAQPAEDRELVAA